MTYLDTKETVKLRAQLQNQALLVSVNDDLSTNIFKGLDLNEIYSFQNYDDLEKMEKLKELKTIANKYDAKITDIIFETLRINKVKINDTLADSLKNINDKDFPDQEYIQREVIKYQKNYEKELETIKKELETIEKFQKELFKNQVKTTEFIPDKRGKIYRYKYVDPYEVFNSIETSKSLHFVHLKFLDKNIYKVWNDDRTMYEENISDNIYIELYYDNEPIYIIFKKDYMELEITKNRNNILGSIKVDLELISEKDGEIRGNFAVPNFKLNRYVFLDIILNDPIISKYFYVDESRKVGPGKKGDESVIYLNFSTDNLSQDSKPISSFLTTKYAGRKDPFVINNLLDIYTEYLNVRVSKVFSVEDINRYKSIFSGLLGYYDNNFNKIKKLYSPFIEFKQDDKKDIKELKRLQRAAPDIFVINYGKEGKKFRPVLADDKDTNTFIFEGVKLKCPEGKYPGLKTNALENKDRYPFLPSCYPEKNGNPAKLYNKYKKSGYNLDVLVEAKTESVAATNKKVKKKALQYGKIGYLPRNIWFLGKDLYREGVDINTNSFINAVLLAVDKDYINFNKQERINYVKDIRRNLASVSKNEVAQQLWDKSSSEIQKDLLDNDVVFDSKLFIGYLEYKYNISIYVISRLEDPNATFEIPRYNEYYLKRNRSKMVVVYKHLGEFGDHLKEPHYELIRNEKKIFTKKDKVYQNVIKYYEKCYKISNISNIQNLTVKGSRDIVDSYGKTRKILFDDYKIGVFTSPQITRKDSNNYQEDYEETDIKTVEEFVLNNGLEIIAKDKKDGKLVGVGINLTSYSYIKIKPIENNSYDNLDDIILLYSETESSVLQNTLKNKRIADYLQQFGQYYLSAILDKQTFIIDDNLNMIQKLESKRKNYNKILEDLEIKIKDNHDFLINVPRKLTFNNSFFEGGILLVDSEETKEKLKWFLYYKLNTELTNVLEYKNKIYLENYYILPEDYTQYPNTTILLSRNSLLDWINSEIIDRRVIDTPDENTNLPQFWKNWVFGDTLLIVQNVLDNSLERAISVGEIYMEKGYNDGFKPRKSKSENYNIIEMKSGFVIKENFNENLPTVYKYSEDKYAGIIFV